MSLPVRIATAVVSAARSKTIAGTPVLERVKQAGRIVTYVYNLSNVVVYNPDGSINFEATANNAIMSARGRDQVNNTSVSFPYRDVGQPVTIDEENGIVTVTLPMWWHDP